MASSSIKNEEEKKEFFDSPKELEVKITQFAEMIRESNCMVAFTGAGISTSTGIPDYRSGFNTVLETGPGCWEKAAMREKWKNDKLRKGVPLPNSYRMPFNQTIQEARPSLTHMAMYELNKRDILKFIISQNIDGLHRRSGIHADHLAELHGNMNLEVCVKCKRQHMRDYNVRNAKAAKKHMTGRICDSPGCGGELKDTIINFGEGLDQTIMQKGFAVSMVADLHVCMGSSMRVSPANQMPLMSKMAGGKIVMINLQKTPINDHCDLVIHERMDKVIDMVMKKLEIPIPEFRRSYRLKMSLSDDDKKLDLTGVDTNGDCYSLFKSLKITGLAPGAQVSLPRNANQKQPYSQAVSPQTAQQLKIQCEFEGHYYEPYLEITAPMDKLREHKSVEFEMVFHVPTGKFEVVRMLAGAERAHIGDANFVIRPSANQRQQAAQAQPARVNASSAMASGIGAAGAKNRTNSQKPNPVKAPVRAGNQVRGAAGVAAKRPAAGGLKAKAGGLGTFSGAKMAIGKQVSKLGAAAA